MTTPPPSLKPCPFCGAELEKLSPVRFPKSGLARLHPGSIDDGSCPIAGWGFYDEQLAHWNTRASDTTITTLAAERDALRAWGNKISRAMTRISGGGSEMTMRIGEDYYADPDAVAARIQSKIDTLQRRLRATLERTAQP